MGSLANIQAYDVTPILRQQMQDAALFQKHQEDASQLAAKMLQMKYQQSKEDQKRADDIVDAFNKLVLSKTFRSDVRDAAIAAGIPAIKKRLEAGDFAGANAEGTKIIADAMDRQEVISVATSEADEVSKAFGQYGVTPEVFKQEYIKRRLMNPDGSWKSPEEVKADNTDYVKDILERSTAPGLFKSGGKTLDGDYGKVKSQIDVTTDAGISSNRTKIEVEHPSYLVWDRVANNGKGRFDIPKTSLDALWDREVISNPVKTARYKRAAFDAGADQNNAEAIAKDLFKQDILAEASTSVTTMSKEDKDNAAYRAIFGITGAMNKKQKYERPNPVEVISGAMATDRTYLDQADFVAGVPGYQKPLIDVTSMMPTKGLAISREGGKLVTADKVLVDPNNNTVVVQVKGEEKKPRIYKGAGLKSFMGSLLGFNGVKEDGGYIHNFFGPDGSFKLEKDMDGQSIFNGGVRYAKSQDKERINQALDGLLISSNASDMNNVSKLLSGRNIRITPKGSSSPVTVTISQVLKEKGKYYVIKDSSGKLWNMGGGGEDVELFVNRLKAGIN